MALKKKTPSAQKAASRPPEAGRSAAQEAGWTFLSNHSHVLLLLAQQGNLRIRDLADRVGITERAVQKILSDLVAGGVLRREKVGRRNHYAVHADRALRHPVEAHCTVADLIAMVRR
ncbi:MAG: winged helix-turn-helix domain-containing protein [Planctomycetota bacterium]